MASVPLFGVGTTNKSPNVSSQRRINMYAEAFSNGMDDKSPLVLYPRPGLVQAFTTTLTKPIRGVVEYAFTNTVGSGWYSQNPYIFAAFGDLQGATQKGNQFQDGVFLNNGSYQTGSGPMRSATNGISTMMVDGVSAYATGAQIFLFGGTADMSDPGAGSGYTPTFPFGADSICYIAGRYVVNDPENNGRFVWSELLAPGLPGAYWPSLNYATAEGVPDALKAVVENNGELLLFGSNSLEFWQPTGGDDVFARVGATNEAWGCTAVDTIQKTVAGLMFLGVNPTGARQVCVLNGYSPQVVSTADVERSIADDPNTDDNANYALAFTIGGHSFYVLNLTNTSWAYNITMGEWSEWQTEGSRWAGQVGFTYMGQYYVSDYRNSNVYTLELETLTDDGEPIVREVQTRHVAVDLERITVDQVALDAEAGVGLSSGQGSDPQVMMQYSKDGGHTWSNEMWETLGALGEYGKRVVWNRLGRARDWVFRFRITDSVKVVLIGAAMRIRK